MKLYVMRKDYYWQTRGVWTVCFDFFTKNDSGEKSEVQRVIQNKHTANRIIADFKRHYPGHDVFIKDTAVKNENLGE